MDKVTRLFPDRQVVFGSSADGFTFEEAGEQLKRLRGVGLTGYRYPLSTSRRFCIKVHQLSYNNLPMRLYTVNEVNAVLATLCHLPIRPALHPHDTVLRRAHRVGQAALLDEGVR